MAQTPSQTVCHFLKKLDLHLPRHSAITLLGMYPKEMKAYIHTKTCAQRTQQLHLAVTHAGKQTREPPHAGRNRRPYTKQPGWISGVRPRVKGTVSKVARCVFAFAKSITTGAVTKGCVGEGVVIRRSFGGDVAVPHPKCCYINL